MKRFLIPVIVVALASWAVFAYIVKFTPPEIGGELVQINLAYFFASGWVGVTTTLGLIFYFLNFLFEETPNKRLDLEEERKPRRALRSSIRRGAVFATALVALGILKIYGLDNLLNSAFVVGIALLIEVYFSSR